MNTERNSNIDAAKAIAAFFVVFIHVKFPTNIGDTVDTISRFSVALFFIISGYFSFSENTERIIPSLKKQVKKLALLAFSSTAVYVIYSLVVKVPYHACSLETMFINLFLFNKPSGFMTLADPLWFLYALMYCHLVVFLLFKINFEKHLLSLAVLLLASHFIIRETSRAFLSPDSILSQFYFVRNWAFFGLPFYFSGHLIHRNAKTLKNISNRWLISAILFSTPLTLTERCLSGINSVYVGTSICAVSIMLLCTNNQNNQGSAWLAVIGKKYTALLYILHPLIWSILPFIFFHMGIWVNPVMPWIIPFIVIIVSLAASHVVVRLFSTSMSMSKVQSYPS